MTAELTDERLAELIAYCESINPVTHPQIVEQLSALRELQAYRAKRETHVWVPRETLAFARNAVARLYGPEDLVKFDAMLAASDGNPP